jgi:predicted Fe-Mo cluster-binding NifX family protein
MKIVMTSTGDDLDAPPTGTFGRCPHFLLIDSESEDVTAVPNPAAAAGGGAGVQAAQAVVDRGAEAVLTGRVGPHAMEVLAKAGVRVFDIGDASARAALDAFRAGTLTEITSAAAPRGHRGRGR